MERLVAVTKAISSAQMAVSSTLERRLFSMRNGVASSKTQQNRLAANAAAIMVSKLMASKPPDNLHSRRGQLGPNRDGLRPRPERKETF